MTLFIAPLIPLELQRTPDGRGPPKHWKSMGNAEYLGLNSRIITYI